MEEEKKPRVRNSVVERSKLSDQAVRLILARIGCYETDEQIRDFLKNDIGVEVSITAIKYYRHATAFQKTIDKYREAYDADIIKVELASKRRRLEELQEIYYSQKNGGYLKEATQTLGQIRVEREGNVQSSGDVYLFNQFNSITDSMIIERMDQNKKMIEEIKNRRKEIEVKDVEIS